MANQLSAWFRLYATTGIISGLTSLINAGLAYRSREHSSKAKPLLLARICVLIILPMTVVYLKPLSDKLAQRKEQDEHSMQVIREMLKRWAKINYSRAVLPAIGVTVSRYALSG